MPYVIQQQSYSYKKHPDPEINRWHFLMPQCKGINNTVGQSFSIPHRINIVIRICFDLKDPSF